MTLFIIIASAILIKVSTGKENKIVVKDNSLINLSVFSSLSIGIIKLNLYAH